MSVYRQVVRSQDWGLRQLTGLRLSVEDDRSGLDGK